MHPFLADIRNLWFPSRSESTIPLLFFITKLSLKFNQFILILDGKAFKRYKSNWLAYSPRVLALSVQLLHLILSLNCTKNLFFNHSDLVENWKYIFMTYCILLFNSTVFALRHVNRVEKEIIILLNSSLLIESYCLMGNYIYLLMKDISTEWFSNMLKREPIVPQVSRH